LRLRNDLDIDQLFNAHLRQTRPVLTISLAAGTAGQTNCVDLHCAGLTPGGTCYIDASTNLSAEWLPIVTLQAAQDGTITFTDTNAVQYPTRFYRLSGN
jgi:hypothetical protein